LPAACPAAAAAATAISTATASTTAAPFPPSLIIKQPLQLFNCQLLLSPDEQEIEKMTIDNETDHKKKRGEYELEYETNEK
jgi:hypothetical protein